MIKLLSDPEWLAATRRESVAVVARCEIASESVTAHPDVNDEPMLPFIDAGAATLAPAEDA
jgi:hypothetical protein